MPTVHARTVRRAADVVGGAAVLAGHLEVREEFITKWMEDRLPVPQEIFLRCVDIVNAHQLDEISDQSSKSLPKGPA